MKAKKKKRKKKEKKSIQAKNEEVLGSHIFTVPSISVSLLHFLCVTHVYFDLLRLVVETNILLGEIWNQIEQKKHLKNKIQHRETYTVGKRPDRNADKTLAINMTW